VEVKEAIHRAREFLESVFEGETIGEIRLEEVGYDRSEACWNVTFSLNRPTVRTNPGFPGKLVSHRLMKPDYKTVAIPIDPNGIPSIKIRTVEGE
jgi:hypothetical protein